MGHYESTSQQRPGESSEHGAVYQKFKSHCSSDRVNTELAVTVAIRENHADTHVTSINAHTTDIHGFAAAGHMDLHLRIKGDNFLAQRTYTPPSTRLEGGQGTLGQMVSFGFYDASYNGRSFNLYEARWRDEFFGRGMHNYSILSPKSDINEQGQDQSVDEFLLAVSKWTSELHEEIYVYDGGHWDKNKHLWKAVQKSTWDDVVMDPAMKDTLISDVQNFFDSRSIYDEYAVPWKRGVILHGTPGCGKTISIKALMNELDKRSPPVASLYVKTFTTSCPGEEYSIREIFEKARVMAPCMLVFEDLDSLVKNKIRSYFLNEVDGLEDNNGILMVGSTNHLDRLDPGIAKRPSRFDRKYHFKIPGYDERILYCEYWKKKLEKNSKVDFSEGVSETVSKLTEGFSFAYLKELFVQTLLTIVGGREHEIDEPAVEEADKDSKVVTRSGSVVPESGSIESTKDDTVEPDAKVTTENGKVKPLQGMPSVEIPEHLKSNPLMRILQKQCIALWKDMDNTNDPEAGEKKEDDEAEDEDGDDDDNKEGSEDYQRQIRKLRIAKLRRNMGE